MEKRKHFHSLWSQYSFGAAALQLTNQPEFFCVTMMTNGIYITTHSILLNNSWTCRMLCSSIDCWTLIYKKVIQFFVVGVLLWGTSWFLLKQLVLPGGYIFSMAAVVIVGYVFGHTLERYTTIHPVVGMTFVGALYRNIGTSNFLDHPVANAIDFHLR